MYVNIGWIESYDPDTGEVITGGGEYHKVSNINFAPQTDLTGNSLPVNQYSIDIFTTDDIPVETINHTLYDDRGLLWADWPITKVQRLAQNYVRVTATSWLNKLDNRQLDAVMYQAEPASSAIEACFGTGNRDYSINAAIAAKTVTGFAPAQTARERLTWLCFVLGAFVVDTFRSDARITGIDNVPANIPIGKTYWRPTVDADKWVTGLKITTYSFRQGTQEEWETDDNSYMFPTPWIATPQTFTLANPDVPEGTPANVVEFNSLYLINPGNVSEIAARLAKYWFNPTTMQLDAINNHVYRPGDMVTAYTGLGGTVSGYIQQASFAFGKQAMSTLKLIGVEPVELAALTINYVYDGDTVETEEYMLPVGVAFSVETLYPDITQGGRRRIYRPTVDTVDGTMVAGGLTEDVPCELALDLHQGVLHVLIVDEITEESSGGENIGVIA